MPATKQREMASAFRPGGFTDKDRTTLHVWSEKNGHCSACLNELVDVVHIGIPTKAYVGICRECLTRMHGTLPALPTGSKDT